MGFAIDSLAGLRSGLRDSTLPDHLVLLRALKDLFETCGGVKNNEIRVDPVSKFIR